MNKVDGQGDSYRATIDSIVAYIASQGAYVDVDLHWSDMGVWGANLGQHFMPDDNTQAALVDVVSHFKNNPAVLFGVYNEPHDVDWNTWRNGGTVNDNGQQYHTPGIQSMVNTVRQGGANNVIIVGGLDWAFDLTGITNGYAIDDTNILYEAHVYPWKGGVDNWDAKVSAISNRYPIFIGEFGADTAQLGPWSNPSDFVNTIHGWLDQHQYSYSAWNLHPVSTPAMITDWCYNTTPDFGTLVKQW